MWPYVATLGLIYISNEQVLGKHSWNHCHFQMRGVEKDNTSQSTQLRWQLSSRKWHLKEEKMAARQTKRGDMQMVFSFFRCFKSARIQICTIHSRCVVLEVDFSSPSEFWQCPCWDQYSTQPACSSRWGQGLPALSGFWRTVLLLLRNVALQGSAHPDHCVHSPTTQGTAEVKKHIQLKRKQTQCLNCLHGLLLLIK